VAGLVAITPASGYVMPWQALIIGLLAGLICYGMVCLKPLFKYDDSLDAFGVHGIGGFLGAVLTGVFATKLYWMAGSGAKSEDPMGKMVSGDERFLQIGSQLLAATVAALVAFVGTAVLVKVIDVVWGFCLDSREEITGLDQVAHGEAGFDFGPSLDAAVEQPALQPRSATVPPDGQERFTVMVDGADDDKLIHAWSDTTVQGNRFRFRGGDPALMRDNLLKLFQKHLGGTLRTYLDSGARKPSNGQSRAPVIS
jgi:hypothetical protein